MTTSDKWHDSLRYFRLSQSTDDLFDAFRNLYLALESILDFIEPRQSRGRGWEREGPWLLRALTTAGRRVDLEQLTSRTCVDPIQALHDELWTQVRNQVFHAKSGQASSYLPLDEAVRPPVLASLARLGRLFVVLAADVFSIRFRESGLGADGFQAVASTVGGYGLAVSTDQTPFSESHTSVSPNSEVVVFMHADRAPKDNAACRTSIRSIVPADEITRRMPFIGRLAAVHEGVVASVEVLEGRLRIDGARIFETVFTFEATGTSLRQSYPS